MPFEVVSRTLAYVSCLATLSLALTSVAYAAVNVGRTVPGCRADMCSASVALPRGPLLIAPGWSRNT